MTALLLNNKLQSWQAVLSIPQNFNNFHVDKIVHIMCWIFVDRMKEVWVAVRVVLQWRHRPSGKAVTFGKRKPVNLQPHYRPNT